MRHQPATSGYTSFCLRSTTAEICEEDVYQGPLSGNLRSKSLCWGQSSGHQIRWGLRLRGWPLRGRWGRIQLCQKVARGEASSRTDFRSKVKTWLFSQPAMPLVSEKMQTGDPGGGERRGWGRGYRVSLSVSRLLPFGSGTKRVLCLLKLPREGSHVHSWKSFPESHPPWDDFCCNLNFQLEFWRPPRNCPNANASVPMAKTPLSPRIHSWIPMGGSSSVWNHLFLGVRYCPNVNPGSGVSTLIP